MKTKTGVWFSFLLSFLLIAPTSYSRLEAGVKAKPNRNPEWAEYIELEGAGNLHKVDDNLYRSEQPTAEGMKNLEKLGIKMVINLRSFHDDKDKIQDTNLLYKRQPMDTWEIKDDDIVQIMRIIEKKDEGPYLIHCLHGADRTGTVVAMYRILYQGWSKEKAIDELKNGGYGFHSMWANIVTYLENVDEKKMREALQEK